MDIDIDLADRQQLLSLINHVPASLTRDGQLVKHNSGVYLQSMPINPFSRTAAIEYKTAEQMGFFKLDLLNVHVYHQIRDAEHLETLMNTEPMWELLNSREFVDLVVHINGHYDILKKMEPIDSIEKMAMFLAVMRPSKRHLIGQNWDEVKKTVWDLVEKAYGYKRSHSIAYATLVVVHMNLLAEDLT